MSVIPTYLNDMASRIMEDATPAVAAGLVVFGAWVSVYFVKKAFIAAAMDTYENGPVTGFYDEDDVLHSREDYDSEEAFSSAYREWELSLGEYEYDEDGYMISAEGVSDPEHVMMDYNWQIDREREFAADGEAEFHGSLDAHDGDSPGYEGYAPWDGSMLGEEPDDSIFDDPEFIAFEESCQAAWEAMRPEKEYTYDDYLEENGLL